MKLLSVVIQYSSFRGFPFIFQEAGL